MTINPKRMLDGYTDCAVWADCGPDSGLEGLDLSNDLHRLFQEDCAAFIERCGEELLDALSERAPGYSDERLGHDFWLTRNRHGAGYWDREELDVRLSPDRADTLRDRLTYLSHEFGPCDLYAGDDQLIHAL